MAATPVEQAVTPRAEVLARIREDVLNRLERNDPTALQLAIALWGAR